MKKIWVAAGVLALALVLYFFASPPPPPAPGGTVAESNSRAPVPPLAARSAPAPANPGSNVTPPNVLASRAASPNSTPATNPVLVLPPLTILDNARVVIHNYQSTFGENPVGTNPEITAALTGANPRQIVFITAESGLRVNGSGELVDGWGTPFFFHQLSGKEMEIRSAGEDRTLWTFDDQVMR